MELGGDVREQDEGISLDETRLGLLTGMCPS